MNNELIEHLISVEQFVLGALEQPAALWRKYLGDAHNDELTRALIDGWLNVHAAARAATAASSAAETQWLEAALSAPQIEQRTKEWYDQTLNVLTASEIWTIFKSHRERAMLVMSKVPNSDVASKRRPNILCIPTEFMSAFDWGIRFEPVIKQIYEHMYGVEVKEVGRLKHTSDPRIAASPDGIVVPSTGRGHKSPRLIEIKCPVSRDIGAEIPPEYYAQMQTQMEVTDAPICDYVEAKLRSGYKQGTPQVEGPAIASGIIWRVACPDDTEKYIYSDVYYKCTMPANITEPASPLIVLETIPWDLLGWHEVTVTRNKTWWENAMVAVESFWSDVEAARRGEFVVPESKRKKATATEPTCLIRFDAE